MGDLVVLDGGRDIQDADSQGEGDTPSQRDRSVPSPDTWHHEDGPAPPDLMALYDVPTSSDLPPRSDTWPSDIFLPLQEDCHDGQDNDDDGLVDCRDPDCHQDCFASPLDFCPGGMVISESRTIKGNTTGLHDNLGSSCGGLGPDAVLTLELTAPQRVTLDASGSAFATVLSLRADCADPNSEQACQAESTLDLGVLEAGTYSIILDGEDGRDQGYFEVDIRLTGSGEGDAGQPLLDVSEPPRDLKPAPGDSFLIDARDLAQDAHEPPDLLQGDAPFPEPDLVLPDAPLREGKCGDGLDNDGDGHTDCADPDCDGQTCGENGMTCHFRSCLCPDCAPYLLWSYRTGNFTYGAPTLVDLEGDGRIEVIAGSYSNRLYTLNGEDGSLLWFFQTQRDIWASPTVADIEGDGRNEIVFGSSDGFVYALNGEDSSRLWAYNTTESVSSTPALADVDGDSRLEVLVGTFYNYTLYALNGEDGSRLWSYVVRRDINSSPAVGDLDGDGRLEVAFGSDDNFIYVLNGENGSLLWSYATQGDVVSSLALGDIDGDGKLEVVAGSFDSSLYALNGENGSLLWSYLTGDEIGASAALGDVDGDGRLEAIVDSTDGSVYAINGENGSLLWSTRIGTIHPYHSSPTLADMDGDSLLDVIARDSTSLYALDGESGSILWIYQMADNIGLATVGDINGDGSLEIVLGTENGISALSTRAPSGSVPPWPQDRHDNLNTGNINGL